MRQYKVNALVLHTSDIFDADRMFLLLTREMGKLRARAKGVRKPSSRLAGHLLPFVPTQLELIEASDGWYLITQAQVGEGEQSYPLSSLSFLRQTELIAESLDKLFIEGEAHANIYDGLLYTYERLRRLTQKEAVDEGQLLLIVAEFLLKALAVLGYHPELNKCVVTGETLAAAGIAWSSQVGGVVSEAGLRQMHLPTIPIKNAKTIVVMRQLLRDSFVAERLQMDDAIRYETVRLIFDYLQTQIGKPLKSYSFMTQTLRIEQ